MKTPQDWQAAFDLHDIGDGSAAELQAWIAKIQEDAQAELLLDVAFLLARSGKAGSFSLNDDEREIGMSSNSIVAIAFGAPIKEQVLPSDWPDLNACERMWLKLPKHRHTPEAREAIIRARAEVNRKYPLDAL